MELRDLYTNGNYHRPNYALSRSRARLYLKHILRYVSINKGQRILEVGCDRGQLSKLLLKLSDFVIGVDINPSVIKNSRNGYLQVMDAEDLKFADESFDHVVSTHTIEHIPDLQKAIHEFERVLRPGGSVALIYPWEPIRGCTVVPEALVFYRSLRVCRLFHVHKVRPKTIDTLIAGTTLTQRNWRVIFGWPLPMFLSILRKSTTASTLPSNPLVHRAVRGNLGGS